MSVMVVVTTAVSSMEHAEELAGRALESGLAACVQVSGPVTSFYTWKGERCRETEWLCVLKTLESCSERLVELIRVEHPYETPEIIVTPVLEVLPEYLDWVRDSLKVTE